MGLSFLISDELHEQSVALPRVEHSRGARRSGLPFLVIDCIKDSFGDYAKFRQEFTTAATTQLGSGWVWLVRGQGKKLAVLKTANVDTPIVRGTTCLLTCDVWEHAYYLDYQSLRLDYVNAWLDKLVNWEFASQQLVS